MYELYIGNKNYSSWSLRPWLLMTELGIPFKEHLVPFDDGGSWSKFRPFSPTGLVPCLVDGDVTVWESIAIVEYLAERYDSVWPRNPVARAWARSAAAEMHAGFSRIRNGCPMSVGIRMKLDNEAALSSELSRLGELWHEGLDRHGGPFLAGHAFSAVDAFFAPIAFRAQSYGLPLDDVAQAYVDRLLELEGMQSWYQAGCAETYREPSHEDEIRALGTLLDDLRAS